MISDVKDKKTMDTGYYRITRFLHRVIDSQTHPFDGGRNPVALAHYELHIHYGA